MFCLSRLLGMILISWALQGTSAVAQSQVTPPDQMDPAPLKSADMNLYFNGGTEEQVLSAGTVLLFNLPAPKSHSDPFDPAHYNIAEIAQRLGNDVALVPLSQVWPVADERTRRWLRLMRCPSLSSMGVTDPIPVLFASIASADGRACVIARASGTDIAQLAEILLEREEQGCRLNAGFQAQLFEWAHALWHKQEATQSLSDAAVIKAAVSQGQISQCGAIN